MKRYSDPIIHATKEVLGDKRYFSTFVILIPVISFLLFLIPVNTIPGNSIDFQFEIMWVAGDHLILIPIAVLESLLLVMFAYLFLSARGRGLTTAGQGSIGLLSAVPAFLFGTKLCGVCLATVIGLLGFGTGAVLPLLQYRQWIFALSLLALLVSLYSVSKKISSHCTKCS